MSLDLPSCTVSDRLRLICMGKGMLMPDSRTLQDCEIPVFKTHPTPVNVSVRPEMSEIEKSKNGGEGPKGTSGGGTEQGCACIIS